ncbi:MAG: hypothetical protein H6884_07545 [Rhodobiaceae bacterium]|nr:hypothetical protein [Rhodobiaceae bacterium]MCC0053897.1 hypothetical protein [Rhodobiaceae bacterium]
MADDNKPVDTPGDANPDDWQKTLPFPKRWIAYVAIKLIVLAVVIAFFLKWYRLV